MGSGRLAVAAPTATRARQAFASGARNHQPANPQRQENRIRNRQRFRISRVWTGGGAVTSPVRELTRERPQRPHPGVEKHAPSRSLDLQPEFRKDVGGGHQGFAPGLVELQGTEAFRA